MAATSEAMAMGVKAGLDPAVMIDVINAGSGRNTASDGKFPQAILPRTFDYGFATALMLKDVRLCVEEAKALDVPNRCDERRARSVGAHRYGIRRRLGLHRHRQDDRAPRRRHRGEEAMSDDIHEVYAVCYASHSRKRSENYIFGDPHDELTSISYYVWVIKGAHGVFVVDTGFDEVAAKERGRKLLHPVGEGLKALGIEPDKVENVIATHMHWDHAGNYELFPKARYHLQDTEMAYATGRCMCHPMLRIPFSERDVHAMVSKVFADRVEFHDGAEELAPGISVHKIGGHSKGLQCVRVKTKRGTVVLSSDCMPSVLAYRRRPRVPDHLFRRRHARGLQDAPEAGELAPAHRAGARPGGAETLSGGQGRAWRTGSCGWMWRRNLMSSPRRRDDSYANPNSANAFM